MKHTFFVALFIVFAMLSKANTITVTNTNDSGSGSLREALTNAFDGDEVRFSPSLIASGNATILLSSEIYVYASIKITGLYNVNDTLYISGGNTNRIFNVDESASVLRKFEMDSVVLINGIANNETGGAVLITDTDSLFVFNSRLSYNSSDFGGAIGYSYTTMPSVVALLENTELSYNNSINSGGALCVDNASSVSGGATSVFLTGCSFLYNQSFYGGGVFCRNENGGGIIGATLTINSSVFIGNIATNGAAFSCASLTSYSSTNVLINNSTFYNNNATSYGGAMFAGSVGSNTTVVANYCTFNNNSSGWGAAIFATATSVPNDTCGNVEVVLTNSTIIANSANKGAAIYAWSDDTSKVRVYNSTIVNNNATTGGGVYLNGDEYSEIKLKSSIIVSNNGGNIFSQPVIPITSLGYNIFSDGALSGSISSDQLGATAGQLQLDPLQLNGGTTATLQPASGSIAIDNGDPSDLTDAQNGAICNIREVGAAENCSASIGLANNTTDSKTIIVAPNPTSNEVAMHFEGDFANLKISDVMGKVIEEKNVYNGEKIDMKNYTCGIYFFIIEMNKTKTICKVVRQ